MYYQTFNSYVPYSPYEPSGEEYSSYRSTTMNSNRFFGLKEGFESGNILKQEYLPYKNYKVPSVTTNNEKDSLLVELMMKYDYMHDLNLILDIYPTDKEALALFLDVRNQYLKTRDEYVKRFGPLCVEDANDVNGTFNYVTVPSPWLIK